MRSWSGTKSPGRVADEEEWLRADSYERITHQRQPETKTRRQTEGMRTGVQCGLGVEQNHRVASQHQDEEHADSYERTKSRRPNNDGKRRGWGGRPVGHAALEWNESPVSTVVSCGFSLWGAKRRWQQGTGLREQYW